VTFLFGIVIFAATVDNICSILIGSKDDNVHLQQDKYGTSLGEVSRLHFQGMPEPRARMWVYQ